MIISKEAIEQNKNNPEGLADYFISWYYKNRAIHYPINPFEILTEIGIPFVFRNLSKLEGLLIADKDSISNSIIAINAKRPIQRQRFSCAHEFCHLIKDVGNYDPYSCIRQSKDKIERYAENFAACFLMPRAEIIRQVNSTIRSKYLTFDDILRIAEYFGTSFQACILRIDRCMPNVLPFDFRSKIKKYKPSNRRTELGYSDAPLYAQVLDVWPMVWSKSSNHNAAWAFKNNYIFNDSRLEGLNIEINELAEEIADIRMNGSLRNPRTRYYVEIAGHSALYDMVFSECGKPDIDIYITLKMNRVLFSYLPHPEFGGRTRTQNTYVIGAKFETVDYHDVIPGLQNLNEIVKNLEENSKDMTKSEILREILSIHHKLTQIHPFCDGNGRTARAFMNFQLLRYGLPPVYILLKDKLKYIRALAEADSTNNLDNLFNLIIERVFKSHADFFSVGE